MHDLPAAFTDHLIDRYEFQRELGRGGMATVYLARDIKHNRSVAVKVLRRDLAATLGAERFLKEIEIAAGLTHPHVLALHDSGAADGTFYYVMPYVDGESLRDLLVREGSLPLDRAIALTKEVAGALTYAHRNGVVHRDIKPENILLAEGHAIVADFGIAKAVSTAGTMQLTRTGFPIGTPGYMSPEQAAGSTDLDARTDVYSLACVFYEMVVGGPPGMWVSHEAERMRRMVDAAPDHRERLDLLPGSIEQALVAAMTMSPRDRLATPAAFAKAIATGDSGEHRRYSDTETGALVRRAAEIQASQPTNALSLGGVQQIAAEVGIPPENVEQAAAALERRSDKPAKGGIFGLESNIALERVVDGEITPEGYEPMLEEIRHRLNEVGRINETLGRSLSWNSLSFQNSMEGTGRLVHVMISPKNGKTSIKITESAGAPATILTISAAMVSFMGSMGAISSFGDAGLLVAAAVTAGAYTVARTGFRMFVRRRFKKLRGLMDELEGLAGGS